MTLIRATIAGVAITAGLAGAAVQAQYIQPLRLPMAPTARSSDAPTGDDTTQNGAATARASRHGAPSNGTAPANPVPGDPASLPKGNTSDEGSTAGSVVNERADPPSDRDESTPNAGKPDNNPRSGAASRRDRSSDPNDRSSIRIPARRETLPQ